MSARIEGERSDCAVVLMKRVHSWVQLVELIHQDCGLSPDGAKDAVPTSRSKKPAEKPAAVPYTLFLLESIRGY